MKDPLMQEFIETQTGLDFAKWRHWATDHGHPHGSLSEFVGRYQRMQQALKRRSIPSTPLPRQENVPSEPTRSHASNLVGEST